MFARHVLFVFGVMESISYLFRVLIIVLMNSGSDANPNYVYATENEDIKLVCPSQPTTTWINQDLKTIALCNEAAIELNTMYEHLFNISTTCDLTILNYSASVSKTYLCLGKNDSSNIEIRLFKSPKNLRVQGLNEANVVYGIVGAQINLTCEVESGVPPETIYWISDGQIVLSGGPGNLVYPVLIKSSQEFEFTCAANNSKDVLETKVKIKIIKKPQVTVTAYPSSFISNKETVRIRCENTRENHVGKDIFTWFHGTEPIETKINSTEIKFVANQNTSGIYRCQVTNSAGTNDDTVNITVQVPPVVTNETLTFTENVIKIVVKCFVSGGVPDDYIYKPWQHYSLDDQLLRTIPDNGNGTITLPMSPHSRLRIDDAGLYQCRVSNGIPDDNGSLWITGYTRISIHGKPIIAIQSQVEQMGHFNDKSTIKLYLVSSTSVRVVGLSGGGRLSVDRCERTDVYHSLYGKKTKIEGYCCYLVIKGTKQEDFQEYSIDVENEYGKVSTDVYLKSLKNPETPTILEFHSTNNVIFVKWEPGFNGGRNQTFVIEYKQPSEETWENLRMPDIGHHQDTVLHNLMHNTLYEIRMYAFNDLGNSVRTQSMFVRTEERMEMETPPIVFISVPVSSVVIFIICVGIIAIIYKRRRGQLQPNGIAFIDATQRNPSHIQVYSTIDRRGEPSQQASQQESSRSSADLVSKERDKNPKRLNYIEVFFNESPRWFYIHGADSRTPYADIDFTATADPLSSSDEDEKSAHGEDDEDFMSLEDIQSWRKRQSDMPSSY